MSSENADNGRDDRKAAPSQNHVEKKLRSLLSLYPLMTEGKIAVVHPSDPDGSDLWSCLNHSLRTPLMNLIGFTEMLTTQKLSKSERRQYAQIIKNNGRQLIAMLDNAKDLFRNQGTGSLKVEKKAFSLVDELGALVQAFNHRHRCQGSSIKIFYRSVPAQPVWTDINLFKRLLGAGFIAALKNGLGPEMLLQVSLVSEERGPQMLLTISAASASSGPEPDLDMPVELRLNNRGRIERMNRTEGDSELFSCSQLAKFLGGELILSWTSTGRKLKALKITLDYGQTIEPREQQGGSGATASARDPRAPHATGEKPLKDTHILVVDDQIDAQILMARILESAGARVTVASNGRQCLALTMKERFSLIVMDIQMPEMDGCKTMQRLRERGELIPAIALTADASPQQKEQCQRAGFNNYCSKPTPKDRLIELILHHINASSSDDND